MPGNFLSTQINPYIPFKISPKFALLEGRTHYREGKDIFMRMSMRESFGELRISMGKGVHECRLGPCTQ